MSQEITNHVVGEHDKAIKITAEGVPGVGGAYTHYEIHTTLSLGQDTPVAHSRINVIKFQEGTVPEKGVNGITMEALMAICIHRLEGFQSGSYPCYENEAALMHLQSSLEFLKNRTRKRIEKGTEGKLQA